VVLNISNPGDISSAQWKSKNYCDKVD